MAGGARRRPPVRPIDRLLVAAQGQVVVIRERPHTLADVVGRLLRDVLAILGVGLV